MSIANGNSKKPKRYGTGRGVRMTKTSLRRTFQQLYTRRGVVAVAVGDAGGCKLAFPCVASGSDIKGKFRNGNRTPAKSGFASSRFVVPFTATWHGGSLFTLESRQRRSTATCGLPIECPRSAGWASEAAHRVVSRFVVPLARSRRAAKVRLNRRRETPTSTRC